MKGEEQPDEVILEALRTHNTGEGNYAFSEWLGAVFFHSVKLGKVPFKEVSSKENRSRNVWTGWLLRIGLIALGIWAILGLLQTAVA